MSKFEDVYRLGIDLGGTTELSPPSCSLDFNGQGRLAAARRDPAARLSRDARCVRGARDEAETNVAIAVGSALGCLGHLARELAWSKNANSTWLIGQPFREPHREPLGRDVQIENDANCLAMSGPRTVLAAGADECVLRVNSGDRRRRRLVVAAKLVTVRQCRLAASGPQSLAVAQAEELPVRSAIAGCAVSGELLSEPRACGRLLRRAGRPLRARRSRSPRYR
jgi:hypothetical protein